MIIHFNDGFSEIGKTTLEKEGFKVTNNKIEQDNLIEYINKNKVEGLIVRSATKVRKDIIDNCQSLKFIARGGVGMDNIDVEYAQSKGIIVKNTPFSSSQSVAELAFGHMLDISRGLFHSNRQMPISGNTKFELLKKNYSSGIELRGKTLGIVGFGRIGRSLAKYALGCGMRVIIDDENVKDTEIELEFFGGQKIKLNVENVDVDTLLKESDFLSFHIPTNKDGSSVVKREHFDKMKDGIRIINCSRGGVIDENLLIEYIDNGKVSYCALDVFENEPIPNTKILNHDKIALSPHIGASTIEAQERIADELIESIISTFIEKKIL